MPLALFDHFLSSYNIWKAHPIFVDYILQTNNYLLEQCLILCNLHHPFLNEAKIEMGDWNAPLVVDPRKYL
jgi:hypothetical protein